MRGQDGVTEGKEKEAVVGCKYRLESIVELVEQQNENQVCCHGEVTQKMVKQLAVLKSDTLIDCENEVYVCIKESNIR